MNFKIRQATLRDIDKGLLDVFIEGYRFHQKGRPDVFLNLSEGALRKNLIKNFEKLETILILDNDNIVGYLSYRFKESNSKKLDIDQLIITEEYRGKGLGKALINEAKNIATNNNCDRIELNCWLFNENALAMYEHIGFDRQRIIYEMPLKEKN